MHLYPPILYATFNIHRSLGATLGPFNCKRVNTKLMTASTAPFATAFSLNRRDHGYGVFLNTSGDHSKTIRVTSVARFNVSFFYGKQYIRDQKFEYARVVCVSWTIS